MVPSKRRTKKTMIVMITAINKKIVHGCLSTEPIQLPGLLGLTGSDWLGYVLVSSVSSSSCL